MSRWQRISVGVRKQLRRRWAILTVGVVFLIWETKPNLDRMWRRWTDPVAHLHLTEPTHSSLRRVMNSFERDDFWWYVEPVPQTYREVSTPRLKRLFPDHQFFHVKWYLRQRFRLLSPSYSTTNVPRRYLAAINGISGDTLMIRDEGSFEEVGTLLAQQQVKINSVSDADEVWRAVCDLLWPQQADRDATHPISSKGHWLLNGDYEVEVDETGCVVRGKFRMP